MATRCWSCRPKLHGRFGTVNWTLLKFADVILPLALPRNYTYSIPPEWEGHILPGCRVAVQFGAHKKYAAVVKRVHDDPPEAYATKPLLYPLDPEPIVFPAQLAFWEWIAQYYMCTEGDVMHAAFPAHLKLTSETRLVFNTSFPGELTELSDDEYLVAEALQVRQELSIDEVQKILEKLQVYALVKQLLDKKVCFVVEELKDAYRPREETIVVLHPRCEDEQVLATVFDEVGRAPKQMEALLAFLHLRKTEGIVRKTALQQKAGVSPAVVKGLVGKQVFILQKQSVDRIPMAGGETHIDFAFSEEQRSAYTAIRSQWDDKQTVLLHGVTSSGKTMLYVQLMEDFLALGKQVLYLLPEIALTAQIVRRLQRHFGDQIGIYHSRFSNNERVEIWNKVKNGEYKIVLGARSSLLLPFKDLGLIILDEEHDASYKQQDPAPRYHARDAALYYASLFGAKVVLGSATPSLESYYNAASGKYGLVVLRERFGGMKLPEIAFVNMKQVRPAPDAVATYLSPVLKEAISQMLAEEKQVILFQNRRGYAPMVTCPTCGWIPHCTNCDVSLTYHKYNHRMHCHYCGTQYAVPATCPACGSLHIVNRNFGTERIEDDLGVLFPGARVARMDLDAVRNKEAHQKLISLFEQRRIDILVGTQMVVKGLDFDHVKLVGILSADNLLSYPDFRVNERAFQLMEQVSGRAGRRDEQGKVIIQALNTTHPILALVMKHDYDAFYRAEIEERQRFSYPPFVRLVRLILKHRELEVVRAAAEVLGSALKPLFGEALLGPSVPPVGRIRNYYLMDMMIKLPRGTAQIEKAKGLLRAQIDRLQMQREFRRVMVIADVDCI